METIGNKLQTLRKQRGLTQEQLARQLCVSRQTVSSWETGRNMPDMDTIKELARFFNTSTDFLISLKEHPQPSKLDARLTDLIMGSILAILLIERITQLSFRAGLYWMDFMVIFYCLILHMAYQERTHVNWLKTSSHTAQISLIIFGCLGFLSGSLDFFSMGFGFDVTCMITGSLALLVVLLNFRESIIHQKNYIKATQE